MATLIMGAFYTSRGKRLDEVSVAGTPEKAIEALQAANGDYVHFLIPLGATTNNDFWVNPAHVRAVTA